jgi:Tfp pilus assembly protein PilN
MGLALSGDHEHPDLRPSQSARRREAGAPAGPVARVACGAVALLAAAVVYLVVISNQVSSERGHLGQLSTQIVASDSQAAALKPYADFANATTTRRAAVASVAKSRFKWDRAMTELARIAPKGVWLTSIKATLAPTTQVGGGSVGGSTSELRGALSVPALELTGCSAHESSIPAYIDRLHLLTGVTEVGFSRSERIDATANAAAGANATAGVTACGGLGKAATFELVAYFKALPAQLATGAAATATLPGATPTPTPAATTATAPANQTPATTPNPTP